MKIYLRATAMALVLCSCSFGPSVSYKVGLVNVEAPSDARKQYGETKIVSLEKEGKTNYQYADSYIDIAWYVSRTRFVFGLKNKSGYSVKIPWDEVVYINANGLSGRVMHSGVKYIDRNNSQPSSVVPKGAFLDDVIIPTDNVYLDGGWTERDLFNFPIDARNLEVLKQNAIGKSVKILLPVVIEGVKNDYIFEFKVEDVIKK